MTRLHRIPGWRKRLEEAMDLIRYVEFDWQAQHDCGIGLCARAVHAITGEDVAAKWRGKYKTERGALGAMKRAGFDNAADLVASILPEIPEGPCMAREGDIAAFEADSAFGYALGVVGGERVLVLRPEGIGTMELLQAQRAFRVG